MQRLVKSVDPDSRDIKIAVLHPRKARAEWELVLSDRISACVRVQLDRLKLHTSEN